MVTFADFVFTKDTYKYTDGSSLFIKKMLEHKCLEKAQKQAIFNFSLAAILVFFVHYISKYNKFKYFNFSSVLLKIRINT